MTNVTPLKLTDEERDLIDWLVRERSYISRSDVLREALCNIAYDADVPRRLIELARQSRVAVGVRACKALARRRRLGDDAPMPAAGNT